MCAWGNLASSVQPVSSLSILYEYFLFGNSVAKDDNQANVCVKSKLGVCKSYFNHIVHI